MSVTAGFHTGRVRARRQMVRTVEDAAAWWPSFVAGDIATSRARAKAHAKAAAAMTRAVSQAVIPTARQRAEREQTAKRAREEEEAARAVVLRRRAMARTDERVAARARRLPAAAAVVALDEMSCRAGPALAMGRQGSATPHEGARQGVVPVGRSPSSPITRKRLAAEAGDERESTRARHIH